MAFCVWKLEIQTLKLDVMCVCAHVCVDIEVCLVSRLSSVSPGGRGAGGESSTSSRLVAVPGEITLKKPSHHDYVSKTGDHFTEAKVMMFCFRFTFRNILALVNSLSTCAAKPGATER